MTIHQNPLSESGTSPIEIYLPPGYSVGTG